MNRPQPVGLVAAGPIKQSLILGLPAVLDGLGPVKGLVARVSSRIANTMRAGRPVNCYQELDECPVVLVTVPDRLLPRIVEEMGTSGVAWQGKAVILCDSDLDSSALAPLSAQGAATASLSVLEAFQERRFVLEGDPPALLALKRLLVGAGVKVLRIHKGRKLLYLAGVSFVTSLVTPLLAGSADCFRKAGVGSVLSPAIAAKVMLKSLRAYRKAGKKGWIGPLAGGDERVFRAQLEAVHRADPTLAEFFERSAMVAFGMLRRKRDKETKGQGDKAMTATGKRSPCRPVPLSPCR